MFCLLCGLENDADAKFCYSCGSRLWGTESSAPHSEQSGAPRRADPTPKQTNQDDTPRPSEIKSTAQTTPVAKPSGSQPAPVSYILRHWRGELTLPVAYWINVFLVGVGVALTVGAFAEFLDWSTSIWVVLVVMLAFWLFVYVLTVWQLVGAWRSAGKHHSRGGSRGWALVARMMLVFGMIQALYVGFAQAVPQITELAKIVSGNDPAGRWQIRVLRNASELEVSGGIGFGLANELRRSLDAHPTVKLIHLNSDGGRIAEARRIRDLIEARGLSTYTATRCVSACVVAFIAGRERMIASGGRLGFHGYAFPGMRDEDFAAELATDRRDFIRRGVDEEFARKAFRGGTEMWYPDSSELVAAGVVTRIAGLNDVAISGIPLDTASVDRLLRSTKLFAAVADHDRETYERILTEYKLAVQRGDSLGELRRRTGPLAMKVVHGSLPLASDTAVLSFADLMLEQMQLLYAKDPAKCHAYVSGLDTTDLLSDLAPTLEREQQIATDVIRTAAEGSRAPPQESAVAQDLGRLWLSMTEWFGDDVWMLENPTSPNVDPKKYCEMTYAFYKTAIELPRPRAARLLKFILGADAAK